jgi:hypothetical protein
MLTFEAFNAEFPNFPFVMSAQYLYRTASKYTWATIRAWAMEPWETPLGQRFSQIARLHYLAGIPNLVTEVGRRVQGIISQEELPLLLDSKDLLPLSERGLPIAMCFPWDHIAGGLVIHNGPVPQDGRFCVRLKALLLPKLNLQVWPVIQLYRDWLHQEPVRSWTPNSPPPQRVKPSGPVTQRGCPEIPRWLNQLTGGGNSAQVFASLLRKREHPDDIVELTYEQVADDLGLDTQQVRRAIQKLCAKKLLDKVAAKGSGPKRTRVLIEEKKLAAAKRELGVFQCHGIETWSG